MAKKKSKEDIVVKIIASGALLGLISFIAYGYHKESVVDAITRHTCYIQKMDKCKEGFSKVKDIDSDTVSQLCMSSSFIMCEQ